MTPFHIGICPDCREHIRLNKQTGITIDRGEPPFMSGIKCDLCHENENNIRHCATINPKEEQ